MPARGLLGGVQCLRLTATGIYRGRRLGRPRSELHRVADRDRTAEKTEPEGEAHKRHATAARVSTEMACSLPCLIKIRTLLLILSSYARLTLTTKGLSRAGVVAGSLFFAVMAP